MNNEELRRMIDGMKIVSGVNDYVDCVDVKVESNRVVDMIARTLSVEYNNACCAENGHDYYLKVCDYVNKQYCALMAIVNERWRSYIAGVELGAELSAKTYIAENYEHLGADKVHRILHMTMINNRFSDFVFTFLTLMNKSGMYTLTLRNFNE